MEKEVTRKRESVTPPPQPASEETRTNGEASLRYATDEQFRKAHAKTRKAHAGLFRRLAQ